MSSVNKYFIGGELEAFIQGAPAGTGWYTTAGTYDSNFSRGCVGITIANTYLPISFTSSQTSFWLSFQGYWGFANSHTNQTWMQLVDGSLSAKYRMQGIGGTSNQPVVQFQYWTGSAWAAVSGIAIVVPTDTRAKFDFNIDQATGGVKAYVNGIPFASQTGLPNYSIAQAQLYCLTNGSNGLTFASEVMCFDVSTLGRRLYTLGETANGTNSQWSGVYTDINEIGTFNDSNFIQTGTIDQTSTFVTSTISSTPAQQYLVSGLVVAGRILIGAVGPQNLKGSVVVSGTTYNSTNNVANLLTSFGYSWADFPVNPNTGLDWTIAQINAGIETGWKSLT